jgi:hypothetical protein
MARISRKSKEIQETMVVVSREEEEEADIESLDGIPSSQRGNASISIYRAQEMWEGTKSNPQRDTGIPAW